MLVRLELNSRPPTWQPNAQTNEPPVALTVSLSQGNNTTLLPLTRICEFWRTRFDSCIVLSHALVLISFFILFNCCVLLDLVREKYSYISNLILHFICVRPRTFSTISLWLERIKNSLVCCRTQQNVRKYIKLTKFVCDLIA